MLFTQSLGNISDVNEKKNISRISYMHACYSTTNILICFFLKNHYKKENECIPTYVIAGKNDFIFRSKKKVF